MKLKNVLKEAPEQWKVKDAIELQKAHERVLKAISTLDKAVLKLAAASKKHRNKPNAEIFEKEAELMRKGVERGVTGTTSMVWDAWDSFKQTGKAIFGEHWN
jgi:hypothetical protein